MRLSGAYESPNTFFVVAYEDWHGNIELTDHTFTRFWKAEQFVQLHSDDYLNAKVVVAKVTSMLQVL